MKLVKFLLPALAAVCLSSCTNTTASNNDATKKETAAAAKAPAVADEEKVFIIRPLKEKDASSIHEHLRPLTSYNFVYPKSMLEDSLRRELASDIIITYTSDTMKLHVKGDLCWIEYISAGTSRARKKDGSYTEDPGGASENSDTVRIR